MATSCLAAFIVLSCFVTVCLGDVTTGPVNTATTVGKNVNLTCTSTITGNERIQFMDYTTNSNGALISDGASLLPGHPNYFRYTLTTDIPQGVYVLTIRNTVIDDGGLYACRDINSLPFATYGYADLVMIDGLPNCTTTLPSNRIVTVGDYYTAECVVKYRAADGIAPYMSWTGAGDFTQAVLGQNGSVWSGTAFNVERVMDGRAFQCKTNFTAEGFGGADKADNVPVWQYLWSTGLIFVQYGPTNMSYSPVQQSYEIGQVLTCYADSVPLSTYKWTNMITLVDYNSQSLTLTPDMVGYLVLRCQAVNSVSTGNLFTNITLNPTTTPAPTTTTTPAPTVPPTAPCDDLTGRWQFAYPTGELTVLCINVDHSQNGLVRGLWWNDSTSDPFFTEIIGRTRNNEYDEIGFTTMWADRIGVSSFAGECHKCYGEETLHINAVSRSSTDAGFCADGGVVLTSPMLHFERVPITYPCSSNYAVLEENIIQKNSKLPQLKRRRRVAVPGH